MGGTMRRRLALSGRTSFRHVANATAGLEAGIGQVGLAEAAHLEYELALIERRRCVNGEYQRGKGRRTLAQPTHTTIPRYDDS